MSKPSDTDEPFLSRWSRKKLAGGAGAHDRATTPRETPDRGAEAASNAETDSDSGSGAATSKPEAGDQIDLSKLPKVEELDAHSDFTAFLDSRVPAVLRNAALARMWTLDPTIRDFIEVAENQWNWNVPGGAPFYEELAADPDVAEMIVQGRGSVIRRISQATESDVSGATLVEGGGGLSGDSRNVDLSAEVHVAVQNDPPKAGDAPDVASLDNNAAQFEKIEPLPNHDALHQSLPQSASEALVRRRHGGALPG